MSEVVEGTATDLPPGATSVGPTDSAPEPEGPQLHGVFIVREEDDEGKITVSPMPYGDVKADQVQTIIELALPAWRQKIGLDK